MSNGEERIEALIPEWRWPDKPGPKTDPVEMFRMIEWYPSARNELVKLRLRNLAQTYTKYAELNQVYADTANAVSELIAGIK